MDSKRRHAPPNPLAGRSGVGPPLCPPGWKWRAGNRVQDMYFTPPGQTTPLRSRPAIQNFLANKRDAPHISEFRWHWSPESQDVPLPGTISPKKSERAPGLKRRSATGLGVKSPVAKSKTDQVTDSPQRAASSKRLSRASARRRVLGEGNKSPNSTESVLAIVPSLAESPSTPQAEHEKVMEAQKALDLRRQEYKDALEKLKAAESICVVALEKYCASLELKRSRRQSVNPLKEASAE